MIANRADDLHIPATEMRDATHDFATVGFPRHRGTGGWRLAARRVDGLCFTAQFDDAMESVLLG